MSARIDLLALGRRAWDPLEAGEKDEARGHGRESAGESAERAEEPGPSSCRAAASPRAETSATAGIQLEYKEESAGIIMFRGPVGML